MTNSPYKEEPVSRFTISANLLGPWKWKVVDTETMKDVAFHVELEDAKASAVQLNENGYVDAS